MELVEVTPRWHGDITPTYKGRDPVEDDLVWLIPCLFVRPGVRGTNLTRDLIARAVELARRSSAKAIEAFPYLGNKRQSKDIQVGFAPIFEAAGFQVIRSPSTSRAVMRRDL